MTSRVRNFVYAATTLILVALLIFIYAGQINFKPAEPTSGDTPKMLSDRDKKMQDPDLLFAAFTDSGLCGGPDEKEGSCSFNAYLYNSGDYVTESSFLSYEHEFTYSSSTKKISSETLNGVIKLIRTSTIMDMKCKPEMLMDAWFSYYINLDGKKRFFDDSPPEECTNVFRRIEQLIENTEE